jgi:pimeloyl-ACP methyl ester carboxylesterase
MTDYVRRSGVRNNAFRLMICCVLLVGAACTSQVVLTPPSPPAPPPPSAAVPTPTPQLDSSSAEPPQLPRIEEITFRSGPFRVVGDLRLPEGRGPHPVVLFVHGSGPADRTSNGSYLPVMERMAKAGYATFSWDKPGTGESTGQIEPNHVISQRAQILLDAIEVMKARSDIDPQQIGLAGISQGGYVMPRALSMSQDIAFMICVSCAGMSGVDQSTYQAMAQAMCAGVPSEKADRQKELLAELDAARLYETYDEYVRYREIIDALFGVASRAPKGYGFEVVPEEAWQVNDPKLESWWNPIEVVQHLTLPVLAFFGDRDTQIDPIQGAHAYREALVQGGNPNSRVELYAGVNHSMVLAETGCLDEATQTGESGTWTLAPGFLDTIEEWLTDLRR